ncbi:MAG: hypothetical protein ACP5P3_01420 [Ignavibacteria bacterium]
MYYYRIFDDKDELNFFKSSLDYQKILELLKEYEKNHQEYINSEFLKYLRQYDEEAEFIEITNIYY